FDDVRAETGTVGKGHAVVVRDCRIDVRGPDQYPIADPYRVVGNEGEVLVGAEQHVRVVDGRIAVIHAERLESAVGYRPAIVHMDDRGCDRERTSERKTELAAVTVHERVGAGLDLRRRGVEV